MIYCSIVQFKWFLWVYRLVDNTKKVLEQKVFSHTSGRLLIYFVPTSNGSYSFLHLSHNHVACCEPAQQETPSLTHKCAEML